MPSSVILQEHALVSILTTVTEVYKKECYGLLLGRANKNTYTITNAITIQKASRLFSSVGLSRTHFAKILHNIACLPGFSLLGEFHSHAQFGERRGQPVLSGGDMRDVSDDMSLQIVIAANDVKNRIQWKTTKEGTINGSLANISMIVRAFDVVDGDAQHLPIQCKFLDKWKKHAKR
jgi:proteasome lid subunit RPN8/RPN11